MPACGWERFVQAAGVGLVKARALFSEGRVGGTDPVLDGKVLSTV